MGRGGVDRHISSIGGFTGSPVLGIYLRAADMRGANLAVEWGRNVTPAPSPGLIRTDAAPWGPA